MSKLVLLSFNDVDVRAGKGDSICLTDLWKATGKDRSYDPTQWLSQETAKQFIEAVSTFLNTAQDCIIKTKRGKGGGTYAHKLIALAYAKYLSPELHILVNNAFFQLEEEERNPDLSITRALNSYKRKGWDDNRIKARIDGTLARHYFTDTLKAHGVNGYGYAQCTDAITKPILGGSAKQVSQKLGLPANANLRDNLSAQDLQLISLSETITSDNIEAKGLKGNNPCAKEGFLVSSALIEAVNKVTAKSYHK